VHFTAVTAARGGRWCRKRRVGGICYAVSAQGLSSLTCHSCCCTRSLQVPPPPLSSPSSHSVAPLPKCTIAAPLAAHSAAATLLPRCRAAHSHIYPARCLSPRYRFGHCFPAALKNLALLCVHPKLPFAPVALLTGLFLDGSRIILIGCTPRSWCRSS
jgi:hypothetical protein